tara:strand:- start:8371 stop:8808 length:438 start_codon:yes stop_codon:yes gene_type:complete
MSFKNFKLVKTHKDNPYKDNPVKDQPNQFIDITDKDKPQLASLDYTETSKSSDQDCQQDRSSEIRDMLNTITKRTNHNYVSATSKAKNDPLLFRKDRALRQLRPTMSADRFADTLKAIARMDATQVLDWVIEAERHLERVRHGHQ